MNWHTPSLEDLELLHECARNNGLLANNYSATNEFLYAGKFSSEICIHDGWILERHVIGEKKYFAFPHSMSGDYTGLKEVLQLLAGTPGTQISLRNITHKELELLQKSFPPESMQVQETPELSDYIYLTENLASLAGKKYSRKRNHISQFERKHSDTFFKPLEATDRDAVMQIERKWLNGSDDPALLAEEKLICETLENFPLLAEKTGASGGIVFVKGEPIAFCIASTISDTITDVHFEKCIPEFARDGGYTVINREFSRTVRTEYINREEDLGIEGLRKSKLSYFPEIILEKYCVTLEN